MIRRRSFHSQHLLRVQRRLHLQCVRRHELQCRPHHRRTLLRRLCQCRARLPPPWAQSDVQQWPPLHLRAQLREGRPISSSFGASPPSARCAQALSAATGQPSSVLRSARRRRAWAEARKLGVLSYPLALLPQPERYGSADTSFHWPNSLLVKEVKVLRSRSSLKFKEKRYYFSLCTSLLTDPP